MRVTKFFLIATFAICGAARAQLQWENRDVELQPSISDTQLVANFYFVNAGNKTVKITGMRTSCGCTTASLEKNVYAPGERGKITAQMEIGGRIGAQEKHVYVTTDQSKQDWVLTFRAAIPEVLKVEPIFLNWSRGEELMPKTADVKVMNNFPVHHLELTSTSPNMAAGVKQISATDFQITLTPRKTGDVIKADIEIAPDFPKNPPKYFHIYTHVDN